MTTPVWIPNYAALKVLGRYLTFATVLALWSGFRGDGGFVAVAVYGVILLTMMSCAVSRSRNANILMDWLPLLALPLLYGAIPRTALAVGPFDAAIQGLDRLIFRTDPARTFAGAAPWRPLSEVLHGAYLSYYAIIYGPPLLMYLRGHKEAFAKTVHAFAVAMALCLVAFCVFPVDGPRYLWPAPSGIPNGISRGIVVSILEHGSSRGTAFPSSHQAIALTMSLSSMRWNRLMGGVLLSATTLLGLGAVYGGFHYATDMIAGALVGSGAWWVVWIKNGGKAAPA